MMHEQLLLKALKDLLNAVEEEIDLDACGAKLGTAANQAEQAILKATETRRNDAYLDQSKW